MTSNSETIGLKTRTGDLTLISRKSPAVMFLASLRPYLCAELSSEEIIDEEPTKWVRHIFTRKSIRYAHGNLEVGGGNRIYCGVLRNSFG